MLRVLAIANVISRAAPEAEAVAALERALANDPAEAVKKTAGKALASVAG